MQAKVRTAVVARQSDEAKRLELSRLSLTFHYDINIQQKCDEDREDFNRLLEGGEGAAVKIVALFEQAD